MFQDDPESYNGARRDHFRWAQSINDLDLRINVRNVSQYFINVRCIFCINLVDNHALPEIHFGSKAVKRMLFIWVLKP